MIAEPPQNTRGQIFSAGLTVAVAAAFIFGGLSVAFGGDLLNAAARAIFSFLVVGLIGWAAEMTLGSTLERVAFERMQEKAAALRDAAGPGGAALPIAPMLTGGGEHGIIPVPSVLPPQGAAAYPMLPGGVHGWGIKGRALDITLPEESIAPAPVAPAQPAPEPVAPAAPVPAQPIPADFSMSGSGDDEFHDLASLLRDTPVESAPARAGGA